MLVFGSNLPAPLRWLERRTRDDLLHPLRAPSLLAVEPPEHTRYRKTVSAVFTPARSPRCATGWSAPRPSCWTS